MKRKNNNGNNTERIIMILMLILTISNLFCNSVNNYNENDVRLFKNTKIWDLALAVDKEDTLAIRKYLNKEKDIIDFQESKLGLTVLMYAVVNFKDKAVNTLLELGADPNLPDFYNGENAIFMAAENYPNRKNSLLILRMLLNNNGNPNYILPKSKDDTRRRTPLVAAAGISLDRVKLLVEYGANINYVSEEYSSPLQSAAYAMKPDIVKYLLDLGADCNITMLVNINGDTIKLASILRDWVFPLNSKEYEIKQEIIKLIKEKCNQDYYSIPVPKQVYENFDSLYIKKY